MAGDISTVGFLSDVWASSTLANSLAELRRETAAFPGVVDAGQLAGREYFEMERSRQGRPVPSLPAEYPQAIVAKYKAELPALYQNFGTEHTKRTLEVFTLAFRWRFDWLVQLAKRNTPLEDLSGEQVWSSLHDYLHQ